MNRTFKVASNKLRGTVVCSEKSSSYQGRAVKTVVAAAVAALVAGTAMAADSVEADPNLWKDKVITEDVTLEAGTNIKLNTTELQKGTLTVKAGAGISYDNSAKIGVGTFSVTGGNVDLQDGGNIQVKDFTLKSGKVTAAGTTLTDEEHSRTYPAFGSYNSFVMEGGDVELSKGGRIWIGSSHRDDNTAYNRMELKGGTITLKDGGYITGMKRNIKAGEVTSDKGGEDHKIKYDENTLVYNTIGLDGVALKVEGKGNVIDAVATELTSGSVSIAKDAGLLVRASNSTNQNKADSNGVVTGTSEEDAAKAIAEVSNFTVKGGTLTNEGTFTSTVRDVFVKDGSVVNKEGATFTAKGLEVSGGTLDNAGLLDVEGLTVSNGGVVSTKYTQKNLQADSVVLLEGGTLKLDALNSRVDGKKIEGDVKGDRLLFNQGAWVLEGGKLAVGNDEQYTGELKIGRANSEASLLIVGNHAYEFSKITFGSSNEMSEEAWKSSTLLLQADAKGNSGSLKVGMLDITNGEVDIQDGVLTVEKLVREEGGKGTLSISDELVTTGDQIFVKGEDGKWALTTAAQAITSDEDGLLTLTDTFSTTADKILAANKLFAGEKNQNLGQIYFENLTLTGDKEGESKVTFDQNLGLAGVNSAVTAPESKDKTVTLTIDGSKMVGVGTLAVDENTENVIVSATTVGDEVGTLVVGGTAQGGNVFSKDLKTVVTDGSLYLGIDSDRAGTVNADTVTVYGNLEVEGNWAAKDLVITGYDNNVAGSLAVDVLTKEATAAGAGFSVEAGSLLKASSVGVDVELGEGATLVLGDRVEREVPVADETNPDAGVSPLAEGDEPAAPVVQKTEKKLLANIEAAVNAVEMGSVVTTNDNGRKLLADRAGKAFDATKNVGLYVDDTVSVSDSGFLVVGNLGDEFEVKSGSVNLGSNAVTVVDLNAFSKDKAVFDAGELYLDGSTTVLLNGADKISTTVLATGEVTGTTAGKFKTDNAFLATSLEEVKDKTTGAVTQTNLVIGYNEDVTKDPVGNVVKDMLTNGSDPKNLEVIHAVGQSGYITADGKLSAEGAQALSEYVTMPVTAGLYNAAYDAQNAFTGAVQERALEKGQSYGVWANAYYAQNEAKTLYGDTGYKSDIYGGVMGADATFSCGARLGAAFTFGKADVDSKNTVNPVNTDSDFWGLSVYTAKDFAGVNVAADVSYVSLGNDISGSIAGVKMDESVDSTVWTIGVKGEAAVYETKNFAVVPHAGIRYAAIDVDDYRGISAEKLNVIELPLGVTVKGNFETAGLTVKPFVDFTAAPQLGDKEVDTLLGETDVLGHVYNAKLGVEAATGAFTFGAHYSYGFGSDDRANNVFGLKASYNF